MNQLPIVTGGTIRYLWRKQLDVMSPTLDGNSSFNIIYIMRSVGVTAK